MRAQRQGGEGSGMAIGSVGVVGVGTMGAGIAEVCARHGYTVVAVEIAEDALVRGRETIEASSARAVEGGKLTSQDRDALLSRISYSLDIAALRDVDLVVEAVPEDLDLKREVFRALDSVTRPEAILATNTSALSVTEMSVSTNRPARVLGLHFFNPAPVQGFCEVVRTVVSHQQVIDEVCAFAESLGKEPVVVDDRAGFIANALLFGYLNHAATMYEQRYASREDIDAAMRFGCGLPQPKRIAA